MHIIILAAGMSTRMEGKNKLLLPFRGKTMLEHTIAVAGRASNHISIVLGHEKELLLPYLDNLCIIDNPDYQTGQESSIRAALRCLDGSEDFAFVPGDLPLLEVKDYTTTFALLSTHEIVRPAFHGTPGHPIAYRAYLAEEALKGKERMRDFNRRYDYYLWEGEKRTVEDIDTPTAYTRLISLS